MESETSAQPPTSETTGVNLNSMQIEPVSNETKTGTDPEFKPPVSVSSKSEGRGRLVASGRSAARSKSRSRSRARKTDTSSEPERSSSSGDTE